MTVKTEDHFPSAHVADGLVRPLSMHEVMMARTKLKTRCQSEHGVTHSEHECAPMELSTWPLTWRAGMGAGCCSTLRGMSTGSPMKQVELDVGCRYRGSQPRARKLTARSFLSR